MTSKPILCQRFIVPPFSILDARQGYWRERKKAWLALGIRGNLGRNKKTKTKGSWSGSIPDYYKDKGLIEKRLGRKLTCTEFESRYLKQLLKKHKNLVFTEKGGMVSVFDPVLCEIIYCWFCPPGGSILDPFAGESTKGIIAAYLGFSYTGIEIRKQQIRTNQKQSRKIGVHPKWLHGDASNLSGLIPKGKMYDLVFTSPPYYDLEIYSKDKKDCSTFSSYGNFMRWYYDVFRQAVSFLKDNRFLVVKVGEIRDKRGVYRNFVGDNISCFNKLGLHYYNEAILITTPGSLPTRAPLQFLRTRKLGKTHQNILVFYKGDPKTVREHVAGDINVPQIPE